MSTVTLSKPHCAITSAENPEGIASQAFTTALPEAQTFFTLFATFVFLPCCSELRHCEEPTGPAFGGPDDKLRDDAIHCCCHSGMVRRTRPGISRFRVRCGACHRAAPCADPLASPRNDCFHQSCLCSGSLSPHVFDRSATCA